MDLSGDLDQLGENLNINLYRIVQESLNNALKHAGAKNIKVTLNQDKLGNLNLVVQDDGVGMDIDQVDQTQHFALLGIRERIQGFHGQFSIESSAKAGKNGRGTKIIIQIPKESIA